MSTPAIDYDALARQNGAIQPPASTAPTKYDQLAQQFGAINQPPADAPVPVPIGNQPASFSGVLQTLKPGNGGLTAAAKGATTDILQGVGEGALETAHGVGSLINKAGNFISPGLGDKIVPPVGSAALANIATPDKGTAQQVGKTAEDIGEFVLGDEALKSASLAERAMKAANLAERYEKASTFTKAAIESVMNGSRQGLVAGAETTGKTGDVQQGLETGAAGAVLGTGLNLAGKGIGAIRDIYRPLATAEAVQPVVQNAIRDVAAKAAADAGVEVPTSTSIRDVVNDLAENVKAKSQPVFEQIDELSNGKFSDAQADAARYRGSLDKAGKDAYESAIQKQNQIFDSVKNQMDPDALNTAKNDWKRFNALADVSDAIQKSTSGTRPEIAAASKAAQPTEAVNPKQLAAKLNSLYNNGTLQTALGNDGAHAILDHAGAAQQRLVAITDALTDQKAKQRVVKSVAIRTGTAAAGTALGGSAIVHGLKDVLASKK